MLLGLVCHIVCIQHADVISWAQDSGIDVLQSWGIQYGDSQGYASPLQKTQIVNDFPSSLLVSVDNTQFSQTDPITAVAPFSDDLYGVISLQGSNGLLYGNNGASENELSLNNENLRPQGSPKSLFFKEGVQSFWFAQQLESQYRFYYDGSVKSEDNTKVPFIEQMFFMYQNAMNPTFFETHVWQPLQFDGFGNATNPCNAGVCLHFPFANKVFLDTMSSDLFANLGINQYIQMLLGTLVFPEEGGSLNSETSVGLVNAMINQLFSCGSSTCGALSENQNFGDLADALSGNPDSLFPNKDVSFYLKNNDNARNPQQYAYRSDLLGVKSSFPQTGEAFTGNAKCWVSTRGFYNDYQDQGTNAQTDMTGEYCFYGFRYTYTKATSRLQVQNAVASTSLPDFLDEPTFSAPLIENPGSSFSCNVSSEAVVCRCASQANTRPCNVNPLDIPILFNTISREIMRVASQIP